MIISNNTPLITIKNDPEEAEERRCQKQEVTSNSARDDTNSASNDTNFSSNYPDSTLVMTGV